MEVVNPVHVVGINKIGRQTAAFEIVLLMYSLVEPVVTQAVIHFGYFVILEIIVMHFMGNSIIAISAFLVKTSRREGYLQVLFFGDATKPTLT